MSVFSQREKHTFERYDLLFAMYELQEVRKTGRPVDVLAAVDSLLGMLDRPEFRPINNRKPPAGFESYQQRRRDGKH